MKVLSDLSIRARGTVVFNRNPAAPACNASAMWRVAASATPIVYIVWSLWLIVLGIALLLQLE
jgi:hypothetical protein